jgi:hypothetical protein
MSSWRSALNMPRSLTWEAVVATLHELNNRGLGVATTTLYPIRGTCYAWNEV